MSPDTDVVSTRAYGGKQMNLFNEAVAMDQQGRRDEAVALLQKALVASAEDLQSRQLLVRLKVEAGRIDEARALLAEGLRLHPGRIDFTLALARFQAESGDAGGAIQLLEAGRAAARDEPVYHALLAALLLRAKRHDEAVQHYLVALRSNPANSSWLIGIGLALEGAGRPLDAAEAYRRATVDANLPPETARFLGERLVQLGRGERAGATAPQ
jgi:MSHA biogenesis protein MshN